MFCDSFDYFLGARIVCDRSIQFLNGGFVWLVGLNGWLVLWTVLVYTKGCTTQENGDTTLPRDT